MKEKCMTLGGNIFVIDISTYFIKYYLNYSKINITQYKYRNEEIQRTKTVIHRLTYMKIFFNIRMKINNKINVINYFDHIYQLRSIEEYFLANLARLNNDTGALSDCLEFT